MKLSRETKFSLSVRVRKPTTVDIKSAPNFHNPIKVFEGNGERPIVVALSDTPDGDNLLARKTKLI